MNAQKSIFDLTFQHGDSAAKIVVALERISESFRVALWEQAKTHQLSPLQVQLLIFLRFHREGKRTVSYLSHEFNMSKPTISDAVRALLKKGHIEKEENTEDRRAYFISLTASGRELTEKIALFANPLRDKIGSWTEDEREILLVKLLDIISTLQTIGFINPQRMCYNCGYYASLSDGPHCQLLDKPLQPENLRLDCPEFVEEK